MTNRIRHITVLRSLALVAAVAACSALPSLAAAQGAAPVAPLPASDYTTRALCELPAPGHAGCMALALVGRTAQAQAHTHPLGAARRVHPFAASQAPATISPAEGDYGYTPIEMQTAYGLLSSTAAAGQTIALVDAYNDPAAAEDLTSYDKEFRLPECTTTNECFKQINEHGASEPLPFPKKQAELKESPTHSKHEVEEATGWGVEISLDIETAHSICESCKIVLVEANSTNYDDLEAAEQAAAKAGATEISNSWGGPELSATEPVKSPFNDPGVVITASAGDDGYLDWMSSEESGYANFPASSPHVVAVGGTHLEVNEATGAWQQESVWNGHGAGGGGCSEIFTAPSWQRSLANWSAVGCGEHRAVADVAADADPYTGVPVRDTDGSGCEEPHNPDPGWCTLGGTSLASPLIAATFALAGGAHGVSYPARTLYENEVKAPTTLHDVKAGSNAKCELGFDEQTGISECAASEAAKECSEDAICLAGVGYDGPTGVGTPAGVGAFEPPAGAPAEEEPPAREQPDEGEEQQKLEEVHPREKSKATEISKLPVVPLVPVAPTSGPTTTSSDTIQLSSLGLTLNAIVALNQGRPKVSHIDFSFTSNRPIRVTATLTRHVRVHRRTIWTTVGRPLSAIAPAGRSDWHLPGRTTLRRGAYRLTLTAAGASAKSITFQIG